MASDFIEVDLIREVFWNQEELRLRAPWRIGAQSLLGFVLVIIFATVFYLTLGLEFTDELPMSMLDLFIVSTVVAQGLGLTISVVVSARFIDIRSIVNLGIRLNVDWLLKFIYGYVLAFLLVSFVFVSHLLTGSIEVNGFAMVDEEVSGAIGFPLGFAVVFSLMVFVGFYEELLVRGYYMKNMAEGFNGFLFLDENTGMVLAAFLSSLGFGVLHGLNFSSSIYGILNIMLVGLLLALMVYVSGGLGYCTGFHVSWNVSMGLIYGYSVSGFHTGVSVVETDVVGSGLLTGGGFGPEASISVTLSVALGFMAFYLWHRWRDNGFSVDFGYSRY